jgi:hypothetical protein
MIDFIQIADAAKNLLNSGTFCLEATIERVIIPELTQADIEARTLKVSVVPKAIDNEPISRSQDTNEYKIDIGIQKKIEDIETEVPTLLIFVKEVVNFLKRKSLPTKPQAHYIGLENKSIYDVAHLSEHHVFTTVITVSYRALD